MSEELQVVMLLGSLHEGSFNGTIVHALPKIVPTSMEANAPPSIADIPLYGADVQREDGFPVTIEALAEQVRQADGVVVVMPEYDYPIPGGLKNVTGWLFHLPDQPLAGKPILIQTGSIGVVGDACYQHHLRQILAFFDAVMMDKPEFMGGMIQNKVDPQTGEVIDQSTLDHLAG